MSLSVLLVGGTGQISWPVLHEAVAAGHRVTVFNRGRTTAALPAGVATISGDMADPASYARLREHRFDVVCQFMAFLPGQMRQDIETFTGRTGQYVFVSSASAYQKPAHSYVIRETTPLENPFWQYSRDKIACEAMLRGQDGLPYTIVRPSHTVRTKIPTALREGDGLAHRLLAGKPVLVPGDGTSLWTLTRSADLARPFVRLFGNPRAIGEDFHITADVAHTWDQIYTALARGLGTEARLVHVSSDILARYHAEWQCDLHGDRMWSVLFDNAKVKGVAGAFDCATAIDEILAESIRHFRQRLAESGPQPSPMDPIIDRVIADQAALGR